MVSIGVAAVLIPAVPAAALTFLTPWSIKRAARNAPRARITRATWATGTSLVVNMRRARLLNSSLERFSRVIAQRWFRVGPGGEHVVFTHAFESLIRNARVIIRATIRGFGPNATRFVRLRPIAEAAVGRARRIGIDDSITRRLGPGKYRLRIYIQYRNIRYGKSRWDNEAPPPGSPHRFTLQAI
jgi:hypothetical protein